jgi:hypothetical protein
MRNEGRNMKGGRKEYGGRMGGRKANNERNMKGGTRGRK